MANYDNAAELGKQMFFKFIQERMTEKKISQYRLAKLTGIPESTISKNFSGISKMTFENSLKICGALELRPFWIPAELDKSEYQRIFFN